MRMREGANFKLLFLISFLIFLLEALAGYLSHSLSLLSDSLHLLSDNLSLLLSFFALKFVKRPPSLKATFGYQKLGLLFTLFNGLFLVLSSLYILYEAIERLKSPNPINLKIMLPVAIVGLLGNVLMLFILRRHHEDIHWKSAWLHILGDTLSSVFVILSGVLIYLSGFSFFDPIASVLIVILLFVGGIRVIRSGLVVFLDLVPPHFKLSEIIKELKAHPEVENVHDVHLWSIGHGVYAFSAHVKVSDRHLSLADKIRVELEERLRSKGITHVVLQMEATSCEGKGELCHHKFYAGGEK